jgi:hypothetical protein
MVDNDDDGTDETERRRAGLCADCRHTIRILSSRGSTFYRCGLSDTDPRFPRYPSLPITSCIGYEKIGGRSPAV